MSFQIHIPADRWHPSGYYQHRITTKLTPDTVVIAGRRPFPIDRVTDLPTERWPEDYVDLWRDAGMPDPAAWHDRPVRVTGRYEDPNADTRIHGTTARAGHLWQVLPEHYSVCRLCLELPPCTHVHNEAIADRASARLTEDMAILPGCCHGCREPITKRQKSFTFPGPNLVRPDLGDHSAIFHTRLSCYGTLTSYDKRWAAAEADRTRWFYCEGIRIWHYDGSSECDNADCHAKGPMERLVDHRAQIWHRPGTPRRVYDVLPEFGHVTGDGHDTCWCLKAGAA